MQVALHHLDLLLLFDNDTLSKTPQNRIAAVDQFELGHVDRALMVRNLIAAKSRSGLPVGFAVIMPASMRSMASIIRAANVDSADPELVSP